MITIIIDDYFIIMKKVSGWNTADDCMFSYENSKSILVYTQHTHTHKIRHSNARIILKEKK